MTSTSIHSTNPRSYLVTTRPTPLPCLRQPIVYMPIPLLHSPPTLIYLVHVLPLNCRTNSAVTSSPNGPLILLTSLKWTLTPLGSRLPVTPPVPNGETLNALPSLVEAVALKNAPLPIKIPHRPTNLIFHSTARVNYLVQVLQHCHPDYTSPPHT